MVQQQTTPTKQKSRMSKRERFDALLRRMQRILRPIFVLLILAVAVNVIANLLSAPAETQPTVKSLLVDLIKRIWGTAWYQLLILSFLGIFVLCLLASEIYVYIVPNSANEKEKDKNDKEFKDALVNSLVVIHKELVGDIDLSQRPSSIFQALQALKTNAEEQKTLLHMINMQQLSIIQHLQTIVTNSEALDIMMKDNNAIHTYLQALVSNTSSLNTLRTSIQNIEELLLNIQSISTKTKSVYNTIHQDIQVLQKHLEVIEKNTTLVISSDELDQTNQANTNVNED
jgi:hypothetical protein